MRLMYCSEADVGEMTHVDGSLVPRPSLALVFDHCSPLSQQDRAAGICEPFATFTSLVASFPYLASYPYLASFPYLASYPYLASFPGLSWIQF